MASDANGYVVKTVFWTLILSCFAFTAGSYAFTWAAGNKIADSVIDNDRLRISDDKLMVCELQGKIEAGAINTFKKLDKMQEDINEMKIMLARITK